MFWIVLAVLAVSLPVGSFEQAETPAYFEGRTIDLAADWEDAKACYVETESAWCFRDEATMDSWLDERDDDQGLLACSPNLRLYDQVSFGTPLLTVATTGTWVNLANYSFNNKTSSYRVGSCSSLFADGASGGSPLYPASLTTAYAQSSTMTSGWNNRVSSVFQS